MLSVLCILKYSSSTKPITFGCMFFLSSSFFLSFFLGFWLFFFVKSAENSGALIRDNSSENDIDGKNGKSQSAFAEAKSKQQKEWKKCATLKESRADITTQEEFYKFDFQVNFKWFFRRLLLHSFFFCCLCFLYARISYEN